MQAAGFVASAPSGSDPAFPDFGPRLLFTISTESVGSDEYGRLVENAREAQKSTSFQINFEPALWTALETETSISDPAVRLDQIQTMFAQQKKGPVSKARRAMSTFSRWFQSRSSVLVLDPSGPSTAIFAMFFSDILLLRARGNGFHKDCSAAVVREGLIIAVTLFGARFDIGRLNHTTSIAACSRSTRSKLAPPLKARMPMSALFHLEALAMGEHYEEVFGEPRPPGLRTLSPSALHFVRGLRSRQTGSLR
jgi:hypothetical protein